MSMGRKAFTRYEVRFESIFDPEKSSPDVREICVTVYADKIDIAMQRAWETVRVTPENYKIVSVHETGMRIPLHHIQDDD